MISGSLPSPLPGSGGKAMLASIGVPSQLGDVLRGAVLPHSRTLSDAVVQVIPSALGIAACALGAARSEPQTTDTSTSFRMNSPVLKTMGRVPRHARVLS